MQGFGIEGFHCILTTMWERVNIKLYIFPVEGIVLYLCSCEEIEFLRSISSPWLEHVPLHHVFMSYPLNCVWGEV